MIHSVGTFWWCSQLSSAWLRPWAGEHCIAGRTKQSMGVCKSVIFQTPRVMLSVQPSVSTTSHPPHSLSAPRLPDRRTESQIQLVWANLYLKSPGGAGSENQFHCDGVSHLCTSLCVGAISVALLLLGWRWPPSGLSSTPVGKKNVPLSQPLQQNIWNRVSLPLIGQSWVNPGTFSVLTRPRLHGNAGTTGAGERGDQLCGKLFFPKRKQGNYQQEEWTLSIQVNHQELWIDELLCLCFLR